MLNKKLFLLISLVLFGSNFYSMNGTLHRRSVSSGNNQNLQTPVILGMIPIAPTPPLVTVVDNRGRLKKLNDGIDYGIQLIQDNKYPSLALFAAGSLVLYKIFEKPIKKQAADFKDFCEEKFLDAWYKWEEIKEKGLTKSDYIKGLVALLATGGLGGTIYQYGTTCKDQAIQFISLLKLHKIELGAAVLGLAVARLLYNIKVALNNRQGTVLNFDKFLGQLSEDQRRIILNSEDLLVALGKGEDNHKRLLDNKEFMDLLSESQKSYLQNIVRYRCSAVRT